MTLLPRNLHTHTERCKHAEGDVDDYCKTALAANLKVLGFSDHMPHPDAWWCAVHMDADRLDDYSQAVDAAKQQYAGRLKVLKGLECEYRSEYHNYFEDEFLGRIGCDYLVAAAHGYPDPDKTEWPSSVLDIGTAEDMRKFTRYTVSMLETGLFTFLAHPDLFAYSYHVWDDDTKACCRDILAAAVAGNVALEINSLGMYRGELVQGRSRYPYPYLPFWELAAEYDITVVCNSDAHTPQDIVRKMDAAWGIARRFNLRQDMMFME